MLKRLLIILLIDFIFCLGLSMLGAQEQASPDSIVCHWASADAPGIAGAIIVEGEAKFLKCRGMADMLRAQPLTAKTTFQVGHLSRQFTALALLIAIQDSMVSKEDDVRKFIPQLKSFDHTIRVRHLLNHTSGLNDYEDLRALVGLNVAVPLTAEMALALITTQEELRCIPGTCFSALTSATEPTLMAAVVAKASGMSFAQFVQDRIFKPLGFSHAFFKDDLEMITPGAAISYQEVDGKLKYSMIHSANAGPTDLFISAEELSTWYTYFDKTPVGLAKLIQDLRIPVLSDHGKTFNTSWGRMTLGRDFFHFERGVPAYWQYSLVGGFSANVFQFPDQKVTSFVLGNNNQYNGMPAMRLSELYVGDHFTTPDIQDYSSVKHIEVAPEKLGVYEGFYWNEKLGFARRIFVRNDTLMYSTVGAPYENPLACIGENLFQLFVGSDDVVKVQFDMHNKNKSYTISSGLSDPSNYQQYQPAQYSDSQLSRFKGDYFCRSLQSTVRIDTVDGSLVVQNLWGDPIQLSPVMENVFRGSHPAFGAIRFTTTSAKQIEGFSIETEGVRGVYFNRPKFSKSSDCN